MKSNVPEQLRRMLLKMVRSFTIVLLSLTAGSHSLPLLSSLPPKLDELISASRVTQTTASMWADVKAASRRKLAALGGIGTRDNPFNDPPHPTISRDDPHHAGNHEGEEHDGSVVVVSNSVCHIDLEARKQPDKESLGAQALQRPGAKPQAPLTASPVAKLVCSSPSAMRHPRVVRLSSDGGVVPLGRTGGLFGSSGRGGASPNAGIRWAPSSLH